MVVWTVHCGSLHSASVQHIVEEVELGTKTTERYESSYVEFFKYAMKNMGSAVSVSGSYLGFSASLSADIKKFRASMTAGTSFGENKVVFTSGGPDMPEPIGLKLLSIERAFDDSFFRALDRQYQCKNLAQRKGNVIRLLKKYPGLTRATTPQDPKVRIPLTWPLGTYGLPMAKSGCPRGTFWHKGRRYHDTEDKNPTNHWSNSYDLAGRVAKNNMEQKFCMKTKHRTSDYNLGWPEGKYCIFKKGNCPAGLKKAFVYWDDEDKKNDNSYSGQLPDGRYDSNTKIEYCCRTDGYATNAITLPTDKPFVLMKSNTHLCQKIKGMVEKEEYFYWDNEDKRPDSKVRGPVGAEKSKKGNIKVHYCYYKKRSRFSWWG